MVEKITQKDIQCTGIGENERETKEKKSKRQLSPVISFYAEAGIHISNTIRKGEARVLIDVPFKEKRETSAFIL